MAKLSVDGVKIANMNNTEAMTGVTVIVCENGASCAVDVRGSAPGTRETDLLDPVNTVDKVHAVVLSGGSAFGLDASCGVMNYLEENSFGFDVGVTKVPIVVQAVLFDLYVGDPFIRPDFKMGYEACRNLSSEFRLGNEGAGTGAAIGKLKGMGYAMKSGLGFSEYSDDSGLKVAALVAVNAFGDVIKGETIVAGCLSDDKTGFEDTSKTFIRGFETNGFSNTNTTIGVIITNADFDKAKCKKISQVAHNGLAKSISPIHTTMDGDTIFTLATGKVQSSVDRVCHIASDQMQKAVYSAVENAQTYKDLISFSDLQKTKNENNEII